MSLHLDARADPWEVSPQGCGICMQPEQLEEGEAVADLWLTSPAATHAPQHLSPRLWDIQEQP